MNLICTIRGHNFEGGSVVPPYVPPACRRCGFVLATRAGISYAEFMGIAEGAWASRGTIEAAKIDAGCITFTKIAAGSIKPVTIHDLKSYDLL